MSRKNKVIFLTGATGLVGSNLIPRILKNDTTTRLILLIRGDSDNKAEERVDEVLWALSSEIDFRQAKKRIQVVRGDITLRKLGLSDSLYARLAKEITHIIHSAATVQFHLPLECARLVNCEGTKNVMALATCGQKNGKLQRVAYISTAYVSGNREGRILEDQLNCGQKFSNTYEQTKFESEKFLQGLMDELPITIFRPSIIVGDSRTGKTTAFNALYVPLKLIYRGLVKILPGSRYTSMDVVPVDFVCDAINHIFLKTNQTMGKVYHLTAGEKNATTAGGIVDLAVEYFGQRAGKDQITQIKFLPLELYRWVMPLLQSNGNRVWQAMEIYEPYLCTERTFDNTNTALALQGTNITPPQFKMYCQTILEYCIETDWGKRLRRAA